jgi:hypothetical protein
MRRTTTVRFCLAGLFLLGAISVVYSQCRHCVDPVQKSQYFGPNCVFPPGNFGQPCSIMTWTETEELTGPIPTSQPNPGCDSRQATWTEARTKTRRFATCSTGGCAPLGPPQNEGSLMIHPCTSPNCEMNCND